MVTRKSAVLPLAEADELADLFSARAIKAQVEELEREKAAKAQAKVKAGAEREFLVVKRVFPIATRVYTQLSPRGTGDEGTQVSYHPGWTNLRQSAKQVIWAVSAEDAILKAQQRTLGDRHGTLSADEAAYWTAHLSRGEWAGTDHSAQAAPYRAVEVQDLSKCPVKGDIPVTPDIADLMRRIAFWEADGDKEMVKALRGMLRDAKRITR